MNYLKLKYIKYVVLILFLYILFSIFIRIVNIYTLLFLIIVIYIIYNVDKKLFKKIIYKVIYKNKKNTLSFKNKYGAAKISLEGVEKISKKINDKVKVELLNYQKNKLESQLKTGDYKVTLFGAGSSGKTSIARSLLKNIVGQTSAKIGTTKQINSYKIRIPILKRNINIVDTPGLFEPSKLGEEREKETIIQASNSDLVLFVLDQDINKYENYLIKELLKLRKKLNKKILLVVDDAYFEYMMNKDYSSGLNIFKNFSNVFILRTFSKIHGLAALRVGWGYGDKKIIKELYKIKPPFNVNKFAQDCAVEALYDNKHIKNSIKHNTYWCKKIKSELQKYDITTNEVTANFFLLNFKNCKFSSNFISRKLENRGIILREMYAYGIKNCLRLTIGNVKENKFFLKQMSMIFKNV